MDFDPEGAAGLTGAQPLQSFEDIADEFAVKIQKSNEPNSVDASQTVDGGRNNSLDQKGA